MIEFFNSFSLDSNLKFMGLFCVRQRIVKSQFLELALTDHVIHLDTLNILHTLYIMDDAS